MQISNPNLREKLNKKYIVQILDIQVLSINIRIITVSCGEEPEHQIDLKLSEMTIDNSERKYKISYKRMEAVRVKK